MRSPDPIPVIPSSCARARSWRRNGCAARGPRRRGRADRVRGEAVQVMSVIFTGRPPRVRTRRAPRGGCVERVRRTFPRRGEGVVDRRGARHGGTDRTVGRGSLVAEAGVEVVDRRVDPHRGDDQQLVGLPGRIRPCATASSTPCARPAWALPQMARSCRSLRRRPCSRTVSAAGPAPTAYDRHERHMSRARRCQRGRPGSLDRPPLRPITTFVCAASAPSPTKDSPMSAVAAKGEGIGTPGPSVAGGSAGNRVRRGKDEPRIPRSSSGPMRRI